MNLSIYYLLRKNLRESKSNLESLQFSNYLLVISSVSFLNKNGDRIAKYNEFVK